MSREYVRTKICGITREGDRDVAVGAGADALGFVVDVPVDTPRELSAQRAAELVEGVPPFVTTVLVTMPDDVDGALELCERVGTDAIQVHGDLSPTQIHELGTRTDADVIAAVDVASGDVEAYAAAADALLVDSTDQQGGGGTGETHDWERTRAYVNQFVTPVVLAGGLTPVNVAEAIETVRPFGIDTATGVERKGGIKDRDAVESFVRRARNGGNP